MNTNPENTRGANTPRSPEETSDRFPFITVGAAAGALLVFLFLMWYVAAQPTDPDRQKAEAQAKAEPKPDAAERLDDLKERNEGALNGVGAKTSRAKAHEELKKRLKGPADELPFPAMTHRDAFEWAVHAVAVGASTPPKKIKRQS